MILPSISRRLLFVIPFFYVGLEAVAASAPADVCQLPVSFVSADVSDTSFVIESGCARLEWPAALCFPSPYNVAQISSGGDTLFHATTFEPSFSVVLRDEAALSTLTIRASNGRQLRVTLRSAPTPAWYSYLTLGSVALIIVCAMGAYFRRQTKKLDDKRHELEVRNVRQTRKFDFATVLFADIQGFTRIAEHMNPEQLVDELDRYFIYFDELVEKYGVEKIKTIGDAYMCAGGLPDHDSANPIEVVLVALEMIDYVNERRISDKGFWNIRVGINTGPVISGHLGSLKKSFDIWGDSVNTASRMESSGEPGRVNISGNTYVKIQDYFDCEHRGRMPVKYKGEVDMYFVTRLKEEFCQPGSTFQPNDLLMRRLQRIRIADFEEKVRETLLRDVHANVQTRMNRYLSRVSMLTNMECFTDDEAVICGVAAIFCFVQVEFPKDNSIIGRISSVDLMKKMHLGDDLKDRIVHVVSHIGMGKHPEDRVEEVIYDAFNEPFGRKDVVRLLLDNYADVAARGCKQSRLQWLTHRKQQLLDYSFYTDSARRLCEVPKHKQIEVINMAMGG